MTERTTVIICAYTLERWDDLQAAIVALTNQSKAPDEVILVVDHNEELHNRAQALTETLPGLKIVRSNKTQGLSGARNTGIAESTSEIVAFLDDDATPDVRWLEELTSPYKEKNVLGTGGRAVPVWPGETGPGWFPAEFLWVVGSSYRGMPEKEADVRNVIGASMSFRKEAFSLAGTFREGLGRVGKNPLGCEETELCIRVQQQDPNARIVYVPTSIVHHRVSSDRIETKYFLARCRAEGISKAQVTSTVGAGDGLASERSYVTKTLPSGIMRGLYDGLRGDLNGPARAGAILAGLLYTGRGYLEGKKALKATRKGAAQTVPVFEEQPKALSLV